MPPLTALTARQRTALLKTLSQRFEQNAQRHKGVEWKKVQARLESNIAALRTLHEMEQSGGDPDVIGIDNRTGEVIFVDCSAQSPSERRSLCYDDEALQARRENKPRSSAMAMASAMGADLLSVEEYQALQKLGEFDTKSSSWVKTPDKIRKLGGALFCDRRYDTVFIYHNGADSYYAARGFRCVLRV